jgi:hypothetical protein
MTIPASRIVQVIPGVEGATGNQLALNGLMLTENYRAPLGEVLIFSDATDVATFFGSNSTEAAQATIYFNGFTGRTQIPTEMLVAQIPLGGSSAWLLGGDFGSLTLSQVKAINGTLSVVVDGYTYTAGSLDLSAATSYSAAAGIIATDLNAALPAAALSASTGGTIASHTATITGYISGNVLTVTATTGSIPVGSILSGGGVTASTAVVAQLTGTALGVGTYAVNIAQNVPTSSSITGTYGLLTLAGSNQSGTFSVGQTITGSGVVANSMITALGTGTGGAGTYYLNLPSTVSSQTITATGTAVVVTYDAISGGLLITSGAQGTASTIAYATGSTAGELFLTAQTGATISQGATAPTPAAFMNSLIQESQNWASFWTTFDPDDGAVNGPGQKLAFAAWTNGQNNRYGYLGWDTDTTPTTSPSATTSFAHQVLVVYDYSGTMCIYDPNNEGLAAFQGGCWASVNFGAFNGRTTMAFRNQTGLVAGVTTDTAYTNLMANGYNFYGAFATANQNFTFLYPGSISGPFLWADSYLNQIFMNAQFQVDLMELLVQANSIPYNAFGGALIEGACLTTIYQMVNFGAIRVGVQLSSLEIEEVNSQAGYPIDQVLFAQGWYFQVQQTQPSVRQARGSPPIFFWYVDGQSVQMITLNSILLL